MNKHAGPGQLSADQAYGVGLRAQSAGDLGAARACYEKILAAAPDHPQTCTMLASVRYQLGDEEDGAALVDRAIKSYENWLAREPGSGEVRAALANLLLARDRSERAATVLAHANLPLTPARGSPEDFAQKLADARAAHRHGLLMTTLPKSASETIWNRLAAGLGLAQCHVSLGLFPRCCLVPGRVAELARGGALAKEHIGPTPHNLAALVSAGVDRVLVHIRDPRQALLSWAHFVAGDVSRRMLAPLWRQSLAPAGVLAQPFDAHLAWYVAHYLPLQIRFIADWQAVADRSDGPAVAFFTFEAFVGDAGAYLSRALDVFGVDGALFDHGGPARDVHLRRGQTEEWRDVLTPEQQVLAWRAIPGELAERFGWLA